MAHPLTRPTQKGSNINASGNNTTRMAYTSDKFGWYHEADSSSGRTVAHQYSSVAKNERWKEGK